MRAMGLLNRTKAPKLPKLACPSCGKPNVVPPPGETVRCILCQSVLPVTAVMGGQGIEVPWSSRTDVMAEAAQAEAAADLAGDEAPDPVDLDEDTSPLRNVVVEDYVPFDMDGLKMTTPGLPRPSTNDV